MDKPRAPLNNKNWEDIDIFLFSNGEQYFPPRKYHLKSTELEFWEPTMHNLARTQFGSMYSSLDLYTLEGKKVVSPLELADATSYVAVKPSEAFIPAGYERYLNKASRSWEKRQEKLSGANATGFGEIQLIKEPSKSAVDEFRANETENIQNPKNTTEKDSIDINNTIISRPRKENESSFEEKQKEYKPLRRKSVDNKIIKNNWQLTNNNSKADSILSKKRNVKRSFSKGQPVTTKGDQNNNKMNITNNPEERIQPKIKSEEKDMKETNVLSKPIQINENLPHDMSETSSDKGLIIESDQIGSSDVYKNPESEVQSVFIEVDRKIIPRQYMSKEKNKTHELHKIDELMSSQKTNKAISVQSISYSTNKYGPDINTSLTSRTKEFNIKLNIKVRDERESTATERSGRLDRCRSYTALLTAEQGSQANINTDLNDEDFKYENSSVKRKSNFCDKAYFCSDFNDAKFVIVNCTCGLSEANDINNKSKDNYIILVPSTLADKSAERSIPDNVQSDKDCFERKRPSILNTDSVYLRSNPVSKENSQMTMKHKVSICPDTPIKISADTPTQLKKHIINTIVNKKLDQFTQTDWCNILLQARVQDDGNSSFHLPPLRLLAQYNLL